MSGSKSVEPITDLFARLPVTLSYAEDSQFTEVYGFAGGAGRIFLEGQLLRPRTPSSTLLIFMHPSSSLTLMPLPRAFAEAGFHVLCAGSRYLRNDTALIMEKVLLDLGAYIRHAREHLDYEHIVLVGWSGGGSLSIFYQAQAERPTVRATAAGDPLDLSAADLPPADALFNVAAHLSRAETMTEWLDPSVLDERNPDERDRELDIYAPEAPHKPPYSVEFVARFRAAQIERNRRITVWCDEQMEKLARSGSGERERGFIVHRTMCDVRWLDPSIDPNGRKINWTYQGDPRTVNQGPTGLARFTLLRSFLSQWSYDRSPAKTRLNAPSITIPSLVIENGADDATPASHPRETFDLLGATDKQFVRIDGATHYYQGQPELQRDVVSLCGGWLTDRGLIDFDPEEVCLEESVVQ